MEWSEITQRIMDAKVSATNPWLWVGCYASGLCTWGLVGTRKLTSGFHLTRNNEARFWNILGAIGIWSLSPVWVPISAGVWPIVKKITHVTASGAEKVFDLHHHRNLD